MFVCMGRIVDLSMPAIKNSNFLVQLRNCEENITITNFLYEIEICPHVFFPHLQATKSLLMKSFMANWRSSYIGSMKVASFQRHSILEFTNELFTSSTPNSAISLADTNSLACDVYMGVEQERIHWLIGLSWAWVDL